METQELRIALDAIRKENADLKKAMLSRQRELNVATNRVVQLEARIAEKRRGLVADDEDARTAEEWRVFLVQSLKALEGADREIRSLVEQLRLLHQASREAFRSAEKIEPSQRAMLEGEMRRAEKILAAKEAPKGSGMVSANAETSALKTTKVVGVNLDLGVAALAAGRKQGVRVGLNFVVGRGKSMLAVLLVVEVRESTSLALIEQMEAEEPIREGDIAVIR